MSVFYAGLAEARFKLEQFDVYIASCLQFVSIAVHVYTLKDAAKSSLPFSARIGLEASILIRNESADTGRCFVRFAIK